MKIIKEIYLGLFIASLIFGYAQLSYITNDFEPSGLDFLSAFVLLTEGVLLWVLTRKVLFPVCLIFSGVIYLTVFAKIDISTVFGGIGMLVGYCFVFLELWRVFDILGFVSYLRLRKKRMAKPSSLEINTRIGGAVITGLTAVLFLAVSFTDTLGWSGFVLVPMAFLMIIMTLAQGISLFKDCQIKGNDKKGV